MAEFMATDLAPPGFWYFQIIPDPTKATSRQHQLQWRFDEEKIAREQRFDGCYIITTDVTPDELKTLEVVRAYKKLGLVEQAFRQLKTVQLEMRPVYHRKDERIRAHVFLCVLAYYLQWHAMQRLAPLFESDGVGENRRWTFANVIETLKQVTCNTVETDGIQFQQNSELTEEQVRIVELLEVKV